MSNPFCSSLLTPVIAAALSGAVLADDALSDATEAEPVEIDAIEDWMAAAGIPGLQLARVVDGEVAWSAAFGVADAEAGDAMTTETPFPGLSLGKAVFAVIVLKLVEEGRFSLDDPVLPRLDPAMQESYARIDRFDVITVRQLLSHTSGLAANARPELILPPGARFSFSGSGIDLLNRAVEHVTGETLEQLATRIVFAPAEMTTSTFFAAGADLGSTHPAGHDRFGGRIPYNYPPRPIASHSFTTTAADYARFLVALTDGRLLGEESVIELFTGQAPVQRLVVHEEGAPDDPRPFLDWGLAFGQEELPTGRASFLWGRLVGFRAWISYNAPTKTGVVWFANSDDGLLIRDALVDLVLPGPHPAHAWIETAAHDDPAIALSRRLGRVAIDDGVSAAKALYGTWAGDDRHRGGLDASRRMIGETGQLLQISGHTSAAIGVLTWNAELFPKDPWAHENLARVLLFDRQLDDAATALRRSLELDPQNRFAYEMLKRLEQR